MRGVFIAGRVYLIIDEFEYVLSLAWDRSTEEEGWTRRFMRRQASLRSLDTLEATSTSGRAGTPAAMGHVIQ